MLKTDMRELHNDPDTVKQASGILQRILEETPEYWPYGLSMDQFDGGLYMLSKTAGSNDFVGFVGWQERDEPGKRVGYYAIGVLPEYRRQGLAKAAIQKLLVEKSAGVDEVRALVVSNNEPSQQLARNIPGVHLTVFEKLAALQKSAALEPWKRQLLTAALGAVGSATFYDQTANPDRSLSDTAQFWKWDKPRALQGGVNAALGALGGHQLGSMKSAPTLGDKGLNFTAGIAALLSPVAKDLMMKGQHSLHKSDQLVDAMTQKALRPEQDKGIPKSVLYGALGLGAGALGLAGYSSLRKARASDAQAQAARGGRVKVTLPTKDPNDAETMLDIPIEDMNLSQALKSRLGRDTRRKLLEETRKRTQRRKAKDPSKPTDVELEFAQLDEEERDLDKAAAAAQPTVPSPPGPGNPALRQTQQSATANSIDTSTAANPQIMKAQQDSAQASMDAQQQVAQAEQKTQQQLMEQQQGFQQQLQQAEQAKQQVVQENQVLKMQVEKSKVEADVAQAKVKAEKDLMKLKNDAISSAGATGDSQLSELVGSRLKRVQQKVTKSATTSPWGVEVDTKRNPAPVGTIDAVTGKRVGDGPLDPVTGKPKPAPLQVLRGDTSQNINNNGFEYMAQGREAGTHLYRTSYGPLLDTLFNYTAKPFLYAPPAPAAANLGMLGELRRHGAQLMTQPQF